MEFLQFGGNSADQHFISSTSGNGKRKKSSSYVSGTQQEDFHNHHVPVRQRSQANARERDRTHSDGTKLKPISVNTAFSTLRTLIPTEPKDRKLSKIETLRLASSYISHLGTQLMAGPIDQPCLRLPKPEEDPSSSAQGRHQICTFCIAHKKSPKPPEDFEYTPNFEGTQIFLNSPQALLTSTGIVSANDLTAIYYQ